MIGCTYNKRFVTRTVLALGNGMAYCREQYLDGSQREIRIELCRFQRWLNGAEPGPAVRHKIGRPKRRATA